MNTDDISKLDVPLIAFFVAATISIVSAHIGLIRLIGNANTDGVKAIEREKIGVLIVIEFSLVILLLGPLPLITYSADLNDDLFYYTNWTAPTVCLVIAIVDLVFAPKRGINPGKYYYFVISLIMVTSGFLLYANCSHFLQPIARYLIAMGLPLVVIAAQFLKSGLRFAGILSP